MAWNPRNAAFSLLGVTIFFVGWAVLAALINRSIVPYPWEVLPSFFENFFDQETFLGELGEHFLISGFRVFSAVIISVVLALPIGLGLGLSPPLNQIFSPVIAIIYPIPKIVFLPVVIILLGFGELSKIFLIVLILIFQILVVVRDEAVGLRHELILSVRSLGAGRRALFRFVYLPASVPAILTALRVSVGTAIAVLFVAETYVTNKGLGYYIVVDTWFRAQYVDMYAGILAMGLLGLSFYFAIDVLEQRFNRWRKAE